MKKLLLLALGAFFSVQSSFATIYGPHNLCYNPGGGGSNAYLHGDSTVAGGGTWLSSNPAVISITTLTASSVMITPNGIGAATITYNGPSGVSTHVVNVDTVGADIGVITGPNIVCVGSTIQVANLTAPEGSWAPGSMGIIDMQLPVTPTIFTTRVATVTGVSVGSALITYFQFCSSSTPTLATKLINVVPAVDCISGDVHFPSGSDGLMAKVWLIKYNPATHLLYAVDSNVGVVSADTIHYQFCGVGTDSFRVKAAIMPGGIIAGTALPTYYTSMSYWNAATVINHTAGVDDTHKDINMIAGTPTSGPGFISGDVTLGANKGTADAIPAKRMQIFCREQATGNILKYTYTDDFGRYSFSNLAVGQSYNIYPEEIGYATTPFSSISLTASAPGMVSARFTQHTISHTITPGTVSVANVGNGHAYTEVFPNPASGILNVHLGGVADGEGSYSLCDMSGRVVMTDNFDLAGQDKVMQVDVSRMAGGLYLLMVRANGYSYTTKVEIK